jgi:uncharacterized protein YaiI (UPF0178 family)
VTDSRAARLRVPAGDWLEAVAPPGGLGTADDWPAEHAGEVDIVITVDTPLADRGLKNGARVLSLRGFRFTGDAVDEALATRALTEELGQRGLSAVGRAHGRNRTVRHLEALARAQVRLPDCLAAEVQRATDLLGDVHSKLQLQASYARRQHLGPGSNGSPIEPRILKGPRP